MPRAYDRIRAVTLCAASAGAILRPVIPDRFYTRMTIAMPAGALRAIGKLNVPLYRISRGRLFGKIDRSPVLLLTSTGRHSGLKRTAPVVYLADDERLVVIGSNAGNVGAPAWSLNLKANPDCEVQLRGQHRRVRARIAEGEERATLWKAINEQYSGFDDYQRTTSRDIAVFVLEPRP